VAVALFLGVNHTRFGRAVSVFVHQQQVLADNDRLVHDQLRSLLVDGARGATHAEFFTVLVRAVDDNRKSHRDA
jgi:hypothetical protein